MQGPRAMIDRRGFMASILAAGFAPAAIGSGVLMPVARLWTPLSAFIMPNDLMLVANDVVLFNGSLDGFKREFFVDKTVPLVRGQLFDLSSPPPGLRLRRCEAG
jgi:hypothetical protein